MQIETDVDGFDHCAIYPNYPVLNLCALPRSRQGAASFQVRLFSGCQFEVTPDSVGFQELVGKGEILSHATWTQSGTSSKK